MNSTGMPVLNLQTVASHSLDCKGVCVATEESGSRNTYWKIQICHKMTLVNKIQNKGNELDSVHK